MKSSSFLHRGPLGDTVQFTLELTEATSMVDECMVDLPLPPIIDISHHPREYICIIRIQCSQVICSLWVRKCSYFQPDNIRKR